MEQMLSFNWVISFPGNDCNALFTSAFLHLLREVRDEEDVEKSNRHRSAASLIGINNRNSATFQVSASRATLSKNPSSVIVVAESGIKSRNDIKRLMIKG